MVNFTAEQFRELMNHPTNIRNMSVIAHVDHGKTTLTDSLLKRAGIGSVGPKRELDTRPDEKERGITIKSTGISLHAALDDEDVLDVQAKQPTKGNEFLINLIDSPGHVDFSAEVTAALRVTDGALVVVDTIEGVSVQTETVLRQALAERIKPVMIINKVDRALLELKLSKEELYQSFRKTVESANAAIAPYNDPAVGDVMVYPNHGTVAFGAGKDGWAFTLRQFAIRASKRFGVKKEKMMERLWGDNFYNAQTRKWTKKSDDPERERGFNLFVLTPIYQIFNTVMGQDVEKHAMDPDVVSLCEKMGITMKGESKEYKGKALLRDMMQKFLPAAEALLEMMIIHLPSPVVAQKYRAETLYEGPMDDRSAIAIRDCDSSADAPLMMYISKMVPSADRGRFFAFGRVFSGTVRAGLKVRIQGPDYIPGTKVQTRAIQRTVLMMGGKTEPLEDCPAGNICGLVGIDQFILKSATLTTDETAHNMRVMKFSVSPVVSVAVSPANVQDQPKLVEGLKRLSKTEPGILVKTSESGENIVSGAGELQLEIALKDLEDDHAGVPIKKSQPIVEYRETVQEESSTVALAKSPNKHNRVYMTAQPLGEELVNDIESGKFDTRQEFKTRGRLMADNYGWDVNQARKIFAFGPTDRDANVIVDATVGIDTREIKDSVVSAFTHTALEGPLAGEQFRGIRLQIPDVKLHADAIHRGMGQMFEPVRRSICGAILYAKPALVEPFYLVDIQVHESAVGAVYSLLTKKRGIVINEEQREGTPLKTLQAHLPVMESFGFNEDLRGATHGQAFPQMVFDHWEIMSGNPLDPNEKAGAVVRDTRIRKGMEPSPRPVEYWVDKL